MWSTLAGGAVVGAAVVFGWTTVTGVGLVGVGLAWMARGLVERMTAPAHRR